MRQCGWSLLHNLYVEGEARVEATEEAGPSLMPGPLMQVSECGEDVVDPHDDPDKPGGEQGDSEGSAGRAEAAVVVKRQARVALPDKSVRVGCMQTR